MALLLAFFRAMGGPDVGMSSQADIDSGFARRERLLRAFFLGLYLDPEGLRRKYGGGILAARPSWPSPSGGTDQGDDSGAQKDPASVLEGGIDALDAQEAPQDQGASSTPALDESQDGDAPLSGANQEDVLMGILQSTEANDGGRGRDASMDLDFL